MRIARGSHALPAVGCTARRNGKKTILSKDISERSDIALECLLKILLQLVRADVPRSKRGPKSGFSMVGPALRTTTHQSVEAVFAGARLSNLLENSKSGQKGTRIRRN